VAVRKNKRNMQLMGLVVPSKDFLPLFFLFPLFVFFLFYARVAEETRLRTLCNIHVSNLKVRWIRCAIRSRTQSYSSWNVIFNSRTYVRERILVEVSPRRCLASLSGLAVSRYSGTLCPNNFARNNTDKRGIRAVRECRDLCQGIILEGGGTGHRPVRD